MRGDNMIYGFYPKQKAYINKETVPGHIIRTQERDLKQEQVWHAQLLNAGFKYNEAHDFYYSHDGALMSDSPISIESLLEYPNYSNCRDLGYDIAYGSPTPQGLSRGLQRAIYCRNYQEILERHKATEQGQKEISDLQKSIEDFYKGVDENSRNFGRSK